MFRAARRQLSSQQLFCKHFLFRLGKLPFDKLVVLLPEVGSVVLGAYSEPVASATAQNHRLKVLLVSSRLCPRPLEHLHKPLLKLEHPIQPNSSRESTFNMLQWPVQWTNSPLLSSSE